MRARRADAVAAELWAELEALRDERDQVRRGQAAWQLLMRASRHADFPVLLDFALEHGLVLNGGETAAKGQAGPTQTWLNPVDGSEMVCIPPGPFVVGPKNQPAACAGFSLARYPVTNQQFQQFLEATLYTPPADHPAPELFLAHWNNGQVPKGKEDHPVVWVSYIDALHYSHWASLT
jgi:serine/threonine-protein kinase